MRRGRCTAIRTAATIAEYLDESVGRASLDRWAGKPAPMIICESRSLAGALRATAGNLSIISAITLARINRLA